MFSIRSFTNTIAAVAIAGSLALTATPALADRMDTQHNSSETGITRTERKSSSEKLRGEGEWMFESTSGFDVMMAMRLDMDDDELAEMVVDLMGDPDLLESEMDVRYEGSFRVRGMGYCEGVEVSTSGIPLYMITCADGEYVNTVMATDKDDALDAMEDMQDGNVPEADGYREVEA